MSTSLLFHSNVVLTVLLCVGVDNLKITHHSEELIIVKERDPLTLLCQSSTPYQWCMWSHNRYFGIFFFWYLWITFWVFLNNFHTFFSFLCSNNYLTVGDIQSLDPLTIASEEGFSWLKSTTKCGLFYEAVNQSYSGSWKCHLADTSNVATLENIRFSSFIFNWFYINHNNYLNLTEWLEGWGLDECVCCC